LRNFIESSNQTGLDPPHSSVLKYLSPRKRCNSDLPIIKSSLGVRGKRLWKAIG
jgi:hypothetical protein